MEGLPSWDHVTQADAFSNEEYKELFEYVRSQLSANDRKLFEVNATYPGSNQRVVYDHWYRLITSTRYGLCFFLAEHESIAMWRLYAPQGFALRTSLRSLSRALEKSQRKWRISRMKYWDKSKEINPDETHWSAELMSMLRRPFFLKSREYEYENEVRLITVDSRARSHLLIDDVAPEDWIEQIRISPEGLGRRHRITPRSHQKPSSWA